MSVAFPLQCPATGEGRFIRQQGSPGRYGHVSLLVEPAEGGEPWALLWEVQPFQIPDHFEEAVRRGIASLFVEDAPLGRWPLEGFSVRVIGGSFHDTDSNELSFVMAAGYAFLDALKNGGWQGET
ncbi:hypothetical protein [Polaromonas aquatica]|uniref:hypothetical protein n=1 Tax=Polaromonas aquatica TaxID=332657 RepID=UPI003D64E65B